MGDLLSLCEDLLLREGSSGRTSFPLNGDFDFSSFDSGGGGNNGELPGRTAFGSEGSPVSGLAASAEVIATAVIPAAATSPKSIEAAEALMPRIFVELISDPAS